MRHSREPDWFLEVDMMPFEPDDRLGGFLPVRFGEMRAPKGTSGTCQFANLILSVRLRAILSDFPVVMLHDLFIALPLPVVSASEMVIAVLFVRLSWSWHFSLIAI